MKVTNLNENISKYTLGLNFLGDTSKNYYIKQSDQKYVDMDGFNATSSALMPQMSFISNKDIKWTDGQTITVYYGPSASEHDATYTFKFVDPSTPVTPPVTQQPNFRLDSPKGMDVPLDASSATEKNPYLFGIEDWGSLQLRQANNKISGSVEIAPKSQSLVKFDSNRTVVPIETGKNPDPGTIIHLIYKATDSKYSRDFYFQYGKTSSKTISTNADALITNDKVPDATTFGASTPDGKSVTVWYNGKQVTSPMTEGLYNVTLKADGYKPVDVTLNVARSDGKLFYIYPVNSDGTGQGTVMNPGTESKPNFNTINVDKKDVSNFGMQLQGVPTSIKANYGDASNFEVNPNGVVNVKKGGTVKDGQKFAVEYTKNGSTETYYFNIKVTDNGKTTPTTGGNSSNSGSTSTSTSTGSTTTTTPVTTPSTNTGSTTTTNTNGSNTVTTNSGQTVTIGNNIGVEGKAVYAIRPIYLYKNATFKKSQRMAYYPKQKRTNRPMFVIVGYEKVNGKLRYEVKDVNHTKNTYNKTGYITANTKYVVPVYYSSVPKSKTITVIAKGGVNSYSSKNLSGKSKHYKKGAHLKVKKIIKHNLTTRYQLTNGKYITANKKLVIQGRY